MNTHRAPRTPVAAVGLLLLVPLLLGGCGSPEVVSPGGGSDSKTAGDEAPVGCGPGPTPEGFASWEECPDDEPSGPGYQLVEARDGLVDPRPVDWLRSKPRAGGTVLRITFWSGVEECYGVAEVAVEEDADSVTVTIMEGREPAAEVCIELAVKKAIDVELSAPLGDREVRDGAEE